MNIDYEYLEEEYDNFQVFEKTTKKEYEEIDFIPKKKKQNYNRNREMKYGDF